MQRAIEGDRRPVARSSEIGASVDDLGRRATDRRIEQVRFDDRRLEVERGQSELAQDTRVGDITVGEDGTQAREHETPGGKATRAPTVEHGGTLIGRQRREPPPSARPRGGKNERRLLDQEEEQTHEQTHLRRNEPEILVDIAWDPRIRARSMGHPARRIHHFAHGMEKRDFPPGEASEARGRRITPEDPPSCPAGEPDSQNSCNQNDSRRHPDAI